MANQEIDEEIKTALATAYPGVDIATLDPNLIQAFSKGYKIGWDEGNAIGYYDGYDDGKGECD